ncbi:hypothetical protein [Paraburkholderia xenovorans]
MASISIPSETAVGLIATALRDQLAAEISRSLHNLIDQKITAMAIQKATELLLNCEVTCIDDKANRRLNLHLSVNGEHFDVAELHTALSVTEALGKS